MKPAKIADFGITEEFGYLPAYEPAHSLSPGNEEWNQFGKDLPKLLMGTNFRARVKALPKFNIDKLVGEAEVQRAMLVLSYIGQAYQWSDDKAATVMPQVLAKPWYEVGKLVGRHQFFPTKAMPQIIGEGLIKMAQLSAAISVCCNVS